MNRNLWAPAGAVAATLAVVAAASLLTTDRRSTAPPVLRIAGAGSADATSVAAPGSGSYQLVGTLPGGPAEATVRDLPATPAPVAMVRALASALGEDAAPVRLDNAWMAGDLKVAYEPGNPWSWGQACDPETAVVSEGTSYPAAAGCTFADVSTGVVAPVEPTGGGLPGVDLPGAVDLPLPLPPPQAQLDEATALAATATLRDAVDLDDAASRIEGTTLVLEPIAGDLPTSGAATVVQVSEKGRLVSATGWLSTGTQGARYPLRSAQEALDDLPVLALGAPCDAAGCP
ncbi:MAG: hypothetical protein M4D85_12385, partial [Actinomycetota bacterium]|nr:hypothetical protein [Actinomycetota bacterium]